MDLWKHRRNTLIHRYKQTCKESSHPSGPWHSSAVEPSELKHMTGWKLDHCPTSHLPESSSTFYITYYDNYKDYSIGSALVVSCGHQLLWSRGGNKACQTFLFWIFISISRTDGQKMFSESNRIRKGNTNKALETYINKHSGMPFSQKRWVTSTATPTC